MLGLCEFLLKCLILRWEYDKILYYSYPSHARRRFVSVKNFMNSMYALNIVIQSFWSLLVPIGIGVLLGWLCTEKLGLGNYMFVIFILLGVAVGIVSMVKFLFSALAGLERLENEQKQNMKNKK